MQREVWQKKSM